MRNKTRKMHRKNVKMSLPEHISLCVKTLRREEKIGAGEFAILCGQTSRSWTYMVEQGKLKKYPRDLVLKFAEIFKKPESYFYPNENDTVEELEEFYKSDTPDLNEVTGYKDKYHVLLVENRKLLLENTAMKTLLIEHGIKPPYMAD